MQLSVLPGKQRSAGLRRGFGSKGRALGAKRRAPKETAQSCTEHCAFRRRSAAPSQETTAPQLASRSRDFGFQNQASCYGNKRKAHGLDNRTGPSQAAGGLCHPQLDESQHNWRIGLRIQWTSNPQTPVAWALTLNSTLSQSPKTRLKPPRHRSPQALTPHTQTRRASPQYSATSSPCRPKPPNLQTILKALQAVQSGQGADFRSCIRCQPAGSGKDTTTDLMIS